MKLQAESRRESGVLLEVDDLHTYFSTPIGLVKSVDHVSFTLERGRRLGIVGESGCGKTVLSRSIMGLLPRRNVVRGGSVLYEGRELTTMPLKERRKIWGAEMAMIFQDPMTSLNPVLVFIVIEKLKYIIILKWTGVRLETVSKYFPVKLF